MGSFEDINLTVWCLSSGIRWPGFESWLCRFLVLSPWTSYLLSLNLNFLIFKTGTVRLHSWFIKFCEAWIVQTHVHWLGAAIHPSHPLLAPSPPALIFPCTRFFSSESALHIRWPKYWSFSFSISPSSEYSRLISFRIDWFDLLVVQGTLKSLL